MATRLKDIGRSRDLWSAPAEVCIRYFRASECDDNSHVLHKGAGVDATARALWNKLYLKAGMPLSWSFVAFIEGVVGVPFLIGGSGRRCPAGGCGRGGRRGCRRGCRTARRGGREPVTLPWQHMPHGLSLTPAEEAAAYRDRLKAATQMSPDVVEGALVQEADRCEELIERAAGRVGGQARRHC